MSPAEASHVREDAAGSRASLTARLPRDATAPAAARSLVRKCLAQLVAPETCDDILLVVSELVTNALLHGAGAIGIRVAYDGSTVTGAVSDEGSGFARGAQGRSANAVGGHGLRVVGRLGRWGVHHDRGAHVWFEIAARPAPRRAA